jgi:hypothetical protein
MIDVAELRKQAAIPGDSVVVRKDKCAELLDTYEEREEIATRLRIANEGNAELSRANTKLRQELAEAAEVRESVIKCRDTAINNFNDVAEILCAKRNATVYEVLDMATRLRQELDALRSAISPHRVNVSPEYYVGVARRMRDGEQTIHPSAIDDPRDSEIERLRQAVRDLLSLCQNNIKSELDAHSNAVADGARRIAASVGIGTSETEPHVKTQLEEAVIVNFLELCVPSLDPETLDGVIIACKHLCENRQALTSDSLTNCMNQAGLHGIEPPSVMKEAEAVK